MHILVKIACSLRDIFGYLEKRMERAVLLMKNTTLSLEEISVMLGYSNHSNFFKAFKAYYGMTPREYTSETIRSE